MHESLTTKLYPRSFVLREHFFRGEEKSQRRCLEWTLSDAQSPTQKSLDSVIWATANACTITSPNIWPENEISCHDVLFLHWPQWWRSEQNHNPYSITERRVPELIPVLGSQPAGDVSHKPGGRLPLLSARPAVTLATLKRAATNFAAWWTEARRVWAVCLRLLPNSVATAIWTRAFCAWVQHTNHSATEYRTKS